jgi:hypothetical protein
MLKMMISAMQKLGLSIGTISIDQYLVSIWDNGICLPIQTIDLLA